MRILNVDPLRGTDEIIDWCRAHELDANQMAARDGDVVELDDGRLRLRRYLLDERGARYLVSLPCANGHAGCRCTMVVATEDIIVTPKRPFPETSRHAQA